MENKKFWILIFIILMFNSCGNSNQRETGNILLQKRVDSLSMELLNCGDQHFSEEDKTASAISFDSEYTLESFKEHVAFYCKNCDYKDLEVKQFSQNIFDISVNKRSNAKYIANSWTGVVVRLTFLANGKFNTQNLQGQYDFGCQ